MSEISYVYSERMLAISDEVKPTDCGGRTAWKREWMKNGREEIWMECSSIDEFAKRASLSKGKAIELDRHFASIYGYEPMVKTREEKKRDKVEDFFNQFS